MIFFQYIFYLFVSFFILVATLAIMYWLCMYLGLFGGILSLGLIAMVMSGLVEWTNS